MALPGVVHVQPFGPRFEVFKALHKVFSMTTTVGEEPIVTLKCEPETGEALRQQHASITPGYHMNKRHWISIAAGPGVTDYLIEELVTNAYLLIVDQLSARQHLEIDRAR